MLERSCVVLRLRTDTGIVVAQPGWSENTSSLPFHAFTGKVTGEGPEDRGSGPAVVENGEFLARACSAFIARPAGIDDLEKVIVQLQNIARR
jgi:hypothetical protein